MLGLAAVRTVFLIWVSSVFGMAVLCLSPNTPWPWPTPAEAASARGGFPTLETEWRGRSEAEVCTSEARKIRVPLARARGGASQEGLVSLLGAERMRSHFVVAVAMGPVLRAGRQEEALRNSLICRIVAEPHSGFSGVLFATGAIGRGGDLPPRGETASLQAVLPSRRSRGPDGRSI